MVDVIAQRLHCYAKNDLQDTLSGVTRREERINLLGRYPSARSDDPEHKRTKSFQLRVRQLGPAAERREDNRRHSR